ncbi:Alpha,alpha-trehalase [Stanieria cyanosphaera PCC 7437]|uniref:Alpha,alpha-trehalase n=1 Tax=Stanieria cyanosphaera (strain ATCC 29371 / PCC 7437) TaxID=111780 RepID=K9XXY9_STAC7|nr:trehalase family glycosidase [Stanieria cyanosphaera]AFZ36522.1 Alpha,alpha-trehalase [Stanieria cyanosphaera PCC 7437]
MDFPNPTQIKAVKTYIKQTWKTLTRSQKDLLVAAKDPKIDHDGNRPWLVYVSPQEDLERIKTSLQQILSREELAKLELRILPAEPEAVTEHGLLYLPHPYVVPGGRFNEMYGWDSYFIILGLLQDKEIELAKSMVEQLAYEIEHYGTILNANRTYLLTRSQPPIFTRAILKVYEYTQDRQWLQSMLPTIESYYYYWNVPPHLNPTTGLSHYAALGKGPAPEVVMSELDEQGRTHYDRVKEYYRQFKFDDYDVNLYYNRDTDELTELFYQGDRSMRESGFDISNRFGPFSIDIIHYAPVCLNVLLYQMEADTARINDILGYSGAATQWRDRASLRQKRINQFLWDQEAGLYFDYNFRTGKRRQYEYATTFYPLWAGIASAEQAQRVWQNLDKFEEAGGILTSTHVSGNQWDAPFGWAPLNLIAVEGLLRYGYEEEAKRIARKFLTMTVQEFTKYGTLVEKYDVCECSSNVSDEIFFGYSSNEIGFGWTNGVVLELLKILDL